MPATPPGMQAIADHVRTEVGLIANIDPADIEGGALAAELMNTVILQAIAATGVNADNMITTADLERVSDYIRSRPALYEDFVEGHGNDEGNEETGFHLVQNDGGALEFQGRDFIDTVADAIYHVGFEYRDGRFRNEDGNANEQVADVAGWLNYFLNGENRVYGTGRGETLNSGHYSFALAEAAHEIFMAGNGNDTIWAGLGDDTIYGGNGNDRSGGGEGEDLMKGGAGHDTMGGDEGDDRMLGGDGNDHLYGDEGEDRANGGNGDDYIVGGQGADVLAGENGNDTVYGGEDNDKMTGDAGNDRMGGGEGRDNVSGNDGNDTVYGEEGDDYVYGNNGNDYIGGGEGDDVMRGGRNNDTLDGNAGNDRIYGDKGTDTLYGGDGQDALWGGTQADSLHGQDGNDTLYGESDDDYLSGGNNKDYLVGGVGDDTLRGGNGRDHFEGGEGVDVFEDYEDYDSRDLFIFAAGDTGVGDGKRDVIKDFTSGVDRLDLRGFGELELQFGSSFSGGGSGEVLFDGGLVRIDANGNGSAEAEIDLRWVNSLVEADFVLL